MSGGKQKYNWPRPSSPGNRICCKKRWNRESLRDFVAEGFFSEQSRKFITIQDQGEKNHSNCLKHWASYQRESRCGTTVHVKCDVGKISGRGPPESNVLCQLPQGNS